MDNSSNFEASQAVPPETTAGILAAGIKALKQQDYAAAIDQLSQLRTAASAAHRVKGQMGLIRAYEELNQIEPAIDLCQPLTRSPSVKVSQWATEKLARLQAQADRSEVDQPPTLTVIDQGTVKLSPEAQSVSAELDQSGFVPIDSAPQPKTNQLPSPTDSLPKVPPESNPAAPPERTLNSPGDEPLETPVRLESSLFHYQQLNAASGVADQPQAATAEAPAPASSESQERPSTSLPPLTLPELPLPSRLRLWGLEIVTAIAFYWLAAWLFDGGLDSINWLLRRLQWIRWPVRIGPMAVLADDHSRLVAIVLLGLLLASPWIMDGLLQWQYGQRPLTSRELKALSPKSLRQLRRICTQRGWPLPELRQLPESAPLCFSYGWHPRNLRIVISQGLIDQFSSEEIASLLAYEMAHATLWDLPVMSGTATVLLIWHQAYWQLAKWGDRQRQPFLKNLVGAIACLCYGVFWLLRKVVLWFSRLRSAACDHTVVALTGQPQVHRHCLVKLTTSIAIAIQRQGSTPPLLESLDYLMPLSQRLALSPGSSADSAEHLMALLNWDHQNPYRFWLLWNLPHMPTGARLSRLDSYQAASPAQPQPPTKSFGLKPEVTGGSYLPPLLLQGSPVIGALIGLTAAMSLWFLGGISNAFNWFRISWFYQDDSIIRGFFLLGIGIGLIVRVNQYFPDIQPKQAQPIDLTTFQKNPLALPVDSRVVKLQGQLLGRSGIANWLCQDLILRTDSGLVRLHIMPGLGPLGNLTARQHHPVKLVGQTVGVMGWLRRGPTLWLDVKNLSHQRQAWPLSNPPLWTTLVGLLACLWGIWILFRGY